MKIKKCEYTKLKKLGHYFNKGLKIGVLTTAIMATGVGCVQNPDDSGYEFPDDNKPTQPEKTPEEINAERDQDLEIYRFNRHRFADVNENFTGYDRPKKLAWGAKRFWEAHAFMQAKVDEFNRMVANDPNASWLLSTQPTPGYLVENLNTHTTNAIEFTVDRNTDIFAKFMAQIQYNFVKDNNPSDYNQFCTCYDKLAVRAYNDSLGPRQNDILLPTFSQDEAEINQELAEYGVTTDANDYHVVEDKMMELLEKVARQTGCRTKTLQAAIEMALYNEGMFGLSDLGGKGYVTGNQVYKPPGVYTEYVTKPRKRSMFNSHTDMELSALRLQNQTIQITR